MTRPDQHTDDLPHYANLREGDLMPEDLTPLPSVAATLACALALICIVAIALIANALASLQSGWLW